MIQVNYVTCVCARMCNCYTGTEIKHFMQFHVHVRTKYVVGLLRMLTYCAAFLVQMADGESTLDVRDQHNSRIHISETANKMHVRAYATTLRTSHEIAKSVCSTFYSYQSRYAWFIPCG